MKNTDMSMPYNHIAIIGGGGAIGQAICAALAQQQPQTPIDVFLRQTPTRTPQQLDAENNVSYHVLDYHNEAAIARAASETSRDVAFDLILITTGILHDDQVSPEKSLKALSSEALAHVYAINTIVPAMIIKHFQPRLARDKRSIIAALSARVGSIGDNRLGGWYAYRASKAALNMIIKNTAIETARRAPEAIVVGLHPGTVDSALSKPFQAHVPADQLFSAHESAQHLLRVLHQLRPKDSGACLGWDGHVITP